MKNKLIKIISGIIIVAVIFIVFLKLNMISTVYMEYIEVTAVSTEHTYSIYKIFGKNYIYIKKTADFWSGEPVSEHINAFGLLNSKADFSFIEKEVNILKEDLSKFYKNDYEWKRYIKINYKNEELDSVEELIEKLF